MSVQESCLSKGIQRCGYHVCVLGGIGSGKCVDGNTLVYVDGVYRRISEIATEEGFVEKHLGVLSENGIVETSHVFKEKAETVIKIVTNHGVEIKCTPEHPLLVIHGLKPEWKQSREIEPGDIILGKGFDFRPAENVDFVYWLKGVFCADGSRVGDYEENNHGHATITVTDAEWPRYEKILSDLGFSLDNNPKFRSKIKSDGYRLYCKKSKNCTTVGIAFGRITEFTKTKRFYEPMTYNQLLSKLAGILDTDSHISNHGIEIVQKRRDILYDIINSLAMLGITGTVSKKFVKGFAHPFYRFFLSTESSKKLATLCLPLVQFVGEKLAFILNKQYIGITRNNPRSCTSLTIDHDTLKNVVCHKKDKHFSACVHQARQTNRVSLYLLDEMFKRGQISFDPSRYTFYVVEEVASMPFDDYVYDVTIPTTHSFIANGLISHNTTLARALQEVIDHAEGDCIGLYEPVESNPLLPLYYQNPERYAFSMQVYMLNRRFEQQKFAQDAAFMGISSVQDSSLFGDSCFVEMLRKDGILCDTEVEVYSQLFANMSREVMYPSLVVYLNCEPEVARKRIEKRGRDCEKGISLDYLSKLKAELDWFILDFQRYTFVKEINANADMTPDEIYHRAEEIYQELKMTRNKPIISRMGV